MKYAIIKINEFFEAKTKDSNGVAKALFATAHCSALFFIVAACLFIGTWLLSTLIALRDAYLPANF